MWPIKEQYRHPHSTPDLSKIAHCSAERLIFFCVALAHEHKSGLVESLPKVSGAQILKQRSAGDNEKHSKAAGLRGPTTTQEGEGVGGRRL